MQYLSSLSFGRIQVKTAPSGAVLTWIWSYIHSLINHVNCKINDIRRWHCHDLEVNCTTSNNTIQYNTIQYPLVCMTGQNEKGIYRIPSQYIIYWNTTFFTTFYPIYSRKIPLEYPKLGFHLTAR